MATPRPAPQFSSTPLRIGVISDTHGLLRAEAAACLAGCELIIHAGDIGREDVMTRLREIAPTVAIRGNIDTGEWARAYREREVVKLSGRSIFVLHDLKELDNDPAAAGFDVVVSGHSHRPKIEAIDGVIYLNPGSAGPRRFKLPVTLATIEMTGSEIRPRIHTIDA